MDNNYAQLRLRIKVKASSEQLASSAPFAQKVRLKTSAMVWLPLVLLLTTAQAWAEPVAVSQDIAPYLKPQSVSGNLNSIGSDTLNNLMTLWAEKFREIHPQVVIQVEGKGSSTAPPALIQGTAQLGPMSREMKSSEAESFANHFGYQPTRISVAIDALAVFTHKDNPLDKLSLSQIDAIFSKARRRGATKPIDTWGEMLSQPEWRNRKLSLYGRNSASGTYGFFKQIVLEEGDFRDSVKEQPGSSAVIQSVSVDATGIGYSGIGYLTSGIKALAIDGEEGDGAVFPNSETVYSGSYPLVRHLYVYVNRKPGKQLDPLTKEFLLFVLSREGQEIVIKDGYFPLTPVILQAEKKKISEG